MVKPIILPISYKSDPKGLRKAEQDLKSFGAGVGKVIAGAVTAVAGIGVASVRAFAQFDGAMNQSLAIMGDVSDTLRGDMADAAREVAKATTFSANEAAESYFFLASAGLDAEQSIAALPKVAAFAQAGMFDMAQATDLLTDAQSALGLGSDDAAENLANMSGLADVLVKANTLANASVEQFASALTNKAAASMRTLNMDMEEGVAVLAVFADQGLKGEAAGTAFNATMIGLTKNARTNAKAFKELGVEVFDSTGELNSMADIVADLERGLDGMSTEQVEATLSSLGLTRQALDGTKALLGNSEALREYEGELQNAGGTVDEIANKQLQTFSAQLALLGSAINDVGIEIGTKLGPTMEKLVDQLGPVIDQVGDVLVEAFELLAPLIGEVAGELPGLLTALLPVLPLMVDITRTVLELAVQLLPIFLGIIQALLPIIQSFANFLANNADKLGGVAIALAGVIIGIKTFNVLLGIAKLASVAWGAATGILTVAKKALVVVMNGAIFAGGALLKTIGAMIVAFGKAALASLKFAAQLGFKTVMLIGQAVHMAVNTAATIAMTVAQKAATVATQIATVAQKAFNLALKMNPIGLVIAAVVALIAALVWFFTQTETGQRIWQGFVDLLFTTGQSIGAFFSTLFTETLPGFWTGMIEGFQELLTTFGEFFEDVFKGVGNFFIGIVNGLITMFEGFVNAVINGLNTIIRAINTLSIDIPSIAGRPALKLGFNIPTIPSVALPRIPALAEGGIVDRATLALIGEAGPEAVVPLDRMGDMGGRPINITVNAGLGTDGAQVGREIVAAIKRYERSSGRVFQSA
jgi:TP901 family phage tail tape measure protein